MCGIVGWVNYDQDISVNANIIKSMLASIQHRGPDDEGRYIQKHIQLAHARLSVMDPENGKQPMHYHQYVIVYNGELYNVKALKKELQAEGYCFLTGCDTEVLIKAYDFWKEKCIDKMNGIFAFFIWDKIEQKGFMARDRLGVKPFFYYHQEDFIFASEIKGILVHPKVDAVIGEDGLKELFLLGPARTRGRTPLQNIYELEPGECAILDQKGLHKRIYWSLQAKEHPHTLEETKEYVKDLVEECVVSQLDSDVGICTFLSGGLDSSIITKIASQRYTNLDTFSIEYEENEKYFKKSLYQPNRDEDYIQTMVEDTHANHHAVILTQKNVCDALVEASISRDLPGMAEVDSSLLLFCREIKKYHSVALSGEGADEILGGYPWYYNDDILYKEGFPWALSLDTRLFCLKDGILSNPDEYILKAYQNTIADVSYLIDEDKKQKRMREMFYLNIRWFLQTLLDRKDRMSMYSGLEVRVPFLDYRLVEYAYNMPWTYKSYNGREKGILREAFRGKLPDEIIDRKKSPYPKSHHPQYTAMLIERIREILRQDCLLRKLLDVNKVEKLIETINSEEYFWYGQLMRGPQILAYFIQMHTFFEEYDVQCNMNELHSL